GRDHRLERTLRARRPAARAQPVAAGAPAGASERLGPESRPRRDDRRLAADAAAPAAGDRRLRAAGGTARRRRRATRGPARVAGDGAQQHETRTAIGLVTSERLGAGNWRLLVEPAQGPWLQAVFAIAAGEREHRATMRQTRGVALDVEIVPEPAELALPAE